MRRGVRPLCFCSACLKNTVSYFHVATFYAPVDRFQKLKTGDATPTNFMEEHLDCLQAADLAQPW